MRLPHLVHRWEVVCVGGHPLRHCLICGTHRGVPIPPSRRGSQPLCAPKPYPPPRMSRGNPISFPLKPRVNEFQSYRPSNAEPSTPPPWGSDGPAGKPRDPDEPNPRLIVTLEPDT